MSNIKIIDKVRINLSKDKYSNWYSNNPKLGNGELILSTADNEENVISFIMIGNGTDRFRMIHNSGKNIFYPGIGAGYQLPTASNTELGGIKISSDYFTITNQTLYPKFLRYETYNYELALVTQENVSLKVDNNIYCKKLAADQVNTKLWVEEEHIKIGDKYIDLHIKLEGKSAPPILSNNEYCGIRFNNYRYDEADTAESDRSVAELSINNRGLLYYSTSTTSSKYQILMLNPNTYTSEKYISISKDNNGFFNLKGISSIPITDISGRGTLTLNIINKDTNSTLNSYSYSCNSSITADIKIPTVYCKSIRLNNGSILTPDSDNNININVSTNYCNSIVVEGQTYNVDTNNTITVGSLGFTDQDRIALNSSIKSLTLNNTQYSGDNVTFNINATTGLVANNSSGKVDLSHYKSADYIENSNLPYTEYDIYNNNSITTIVNVQRDELGHITSYNNATLIFKTLVDKIKDLEQRLEALEK